jgi:Ca-activated chloride channel family protein
MLALLPLPLLVWWLLAAYRESSASVRLPFFHEVADAAGLEPAAGAVVPRRNWLQWILAPLAWALVVLALARPQFVEPPMEKVLPARDLLLALDLSQSMDTNDFKSPSGARETRVRAVQQVVREFVAQRKGDRIGLIVFGEAPYPLAPFTMDHELVITLIDGVLPGMAGPRTALGDALGLAIKMFDESKAQQKVLIVLTDGNDTASKMPPARAAEIAKDRGVVVHTVAIGDANATGEDKVDLETLRTVASSTGGTFHFGGDQKQLQEIYAALDKITPENQKVLSWRPKIELFMWPLGAAVGLVLLYHLLMFIYTMWRRMWRSLHTPKGAPATTPTTAERST